MAVLENRNLMICADEASGEVWLQDKRHQQGWRLDRRHLRFCRDEGKAECLNTPFRLTCEPDAFLLHWHLPDGELRMRWRLGDDHVGATLEQVPATIRDIAFPGSFLPESGMADLLFPCYQGIWFKAGGECWEEVHLPGGHDNFSLSMVALLGPRGGLLMTQERLISSWSCRLGQAEDHTYCSLEQWRCAVNGWQQREVRLYPVESGITAVARRYRQRIIERGELRTWEEKIASKPVLNQFFGSLMAFIGYFREPGLDYADHAARLRALGFENVLYYPVRLAHYRPVNVDGNDGIWLSDEEIDAMHRVPGALLAPWAWLEDVPDDGSPEMRHLMRKGPEGQFAFGWKINDTQWNRACEALEIETMQRFYKNELRDMDWVHYDVNATFALRHPACFALDHAHHMGQPDSSESQAQRVQMLFSEAINGNRIVSSEGLCDRLAMAYDIGSTKVLPNTTNGTRFISVPLTGLVLHDSVAHDWWEVENYNELPGFPVRIGWKGRPFGSGMAAKKAATDALYGCPPNVFPFGRQYGWADLQSHRTYIFSIRLEDVAVQQALKLALPVCKLHRRTGPQDMVDFRFLADDCSVQTTRFADGLRVVANIGDFPRECEGVGTLAPDEWRVVDEG